MLWRRVGAAVLVLAELAPALVVVVGMATGTHRQFARGVTDAWVVPVMLGLGVVCLVVLGAAAARAVRLRSGAFLWFAGALASWLVWAFWRIVEYSS